MGFFSKVFGEFGKFEKFERGKKRKIRGLFLATTQKKCVEFIFCWFLIGSILAKDIHLMRFFFFICRIIEKEKIVGRRHDKLFFFSSDTAGFPQLLFGHLVQKKCRYLFIYLFIFFFPEEKKINLGEDFSQRFGRSGGRDCVKSHRYQTKKRRVNINTGSFLILCAITERERGCNKHLHTLAYPPKNTHTNIPAQFRKRNKWAMTSADRRVKESGRKKKKRKLKFKHFIFFQA